MDIDEVMVYSISVIDSESMALGFTEGVVKEGFMGGTKEATIHLEGSVGEGFCAVCGCTVGCIQ